ncbi:PhzF family phenazine biosynthesis protein [Streptomyces sp. NPDC017254]|uniref:PhzF family phenazine biosynthesis protein n=1 Tax=unclassified Streptomyces TaxID=2593676 RepID=UPI0037A5FACD
MPEVTIVDACRRQGRGGSPTAVLDDAPFTDAERRRIPAETGTSHAVFIAAVDGEDQARPSYRLRFFTGEGELPACGHGTVAALALLAQRNSGDADYRATLHTTSRVFEGWATREHDVLTATFDPGPISSRDTGESELRSTIIANAQRGASGTLIRLGGAAEIARAVRLPRLG